MLHLLGGPNGTSNGGEPSRHSKRRAAPLAASLSLGSAAPSNKRARLESSAESRESDLVNIISNFNIDVNELFQLKEYGSLADWNPEDFSPATRGELPEIFQYFIQNNKYQLIWDDQSTESLDNLPLRLQKKVLADREIKLREKYPFMDDVQRRSLEREAALLTPAKKHLPPKLIAPARKLKSDAMPVVSPSIEPEPFESSAEELDTPTDTHYILKSLSYSLPPPVVTHPSHIPSWRPSRTDSEFYNNDIDAHHLIDFTFKPNRVIWGKLEGFQSPGLQLKITDFLENKYKSSIIDDASAEVTSSPEEYQATLKAQKTLIRKLHQKIVEDGSFELNGDKIERRKVVLPQSSKNSLDPFRENGCIAPKLQGAANDNTFQDHLVSQGMSFSRLHQGMRRQHQARIRRIVQIVEQHFRKKAGEKERAAREREQNLRKISRLAIQAVRKRWAQANKVYKYLQHEKDEELKQIEGREHLSKMLKHSTQLLEAQLNRSSDGTVEPESRLISNSEDSDSKDSDVFSSTSESEYASGGESPLRDEPGDNELSITELKEKYSSLEPVKDDESDQNDSSETAANGTLASLYGAEKLKSDTPPEYTTEQLSLIDSLSKRDETDNLGSSDESSLMTDESSEDEMTDTSSDEEQSLSEPVGLSSLYDAKVTNTVSKEVTSEDTAVKEETNERQLISNLRSDDDENVEEINGFKVKDVPLPSLLRGTLRPYQKQGLNWLASLYNNDTNGILADEMGLGKTIQTISLLAYLACEHHIWGPHLIVVPTSVMLNWEMEFKKFAPGFKVMTYYGSPQERARKRKGWNKQDAFHVCITSYQLVVHDHSSFKRKRWRYMILDEAHNIKNFRSTRWKALLNFNTENRLLLTGTPLQNNLMELWSLLYFLMPSSKVEQMMPEGFANFEDFQQWFGKPVDKILEKTATGDLIDDNVTKNLDKETKDTVSRLHQVLRPYLLRRLKKDVEKQMPGKYEHIIYCRLSKRQRYLYDDFMSRAKTKETLASGNFLSIINCLMQLRKVCNHPDLFEVRPIVTSFAMPRIAYHSYNSSDAVVRKLLNDTKNPKASLPVLNLDITLADDMNYFAAEANMRLISQSQFDEEIAKINDIIEKGLLDKDSVSEGSVMSDILQVSRRIKLQEQIELLERLKHAAYLNRLRCLRKPLYGASFMSFVEKACAISNCELVQKMVLSIPERQAKTSDVVSKYGVVTPAAVALDMKDQLIPVRTQYRIREEVQKNAITNPYHQAQVKLSIAFPDKQLLQYDCGKLQKLASLLQELIPNGHRALIFTQMTKVLDILEQFLNLHGYRYLRLDGATKIEERQLLTEKFNRDPKIPVFILSTRSGGLGINLTGADTVIFYDSDWNPAMDKQCQDRCHRIGQMRDVHIYRFVSEYTIESNILKKANQKRQLDNVVIQEGDFTTDYLGKFSVKDLVNDTSIAVDLPDKPIGENANMELLAQAEDEADRNAAKEAMKEVAVDEEDFVDEIKHENGNAIEKQELGDSDYEEGVGHLDEYMLRCIGEGYYVE